MDCKNLKEEMLNYYLYNYYYNIGCLSLMINDYHNCIDMNGSTNESNL
jgi:hypothetical protein